MKNNFSCFWKLLYSTTVLSWNSSRNFFMDCESVFQTLKYTFFWCFGGWMDVHIIRSRTKAVTWKKNLEWMIELVVTLFPWGWVAPSGFENSSLGRFPRSNCEISGRYMGITPSKTTFAANYTPTFTRS